MIWMTVGMVLPWLIVGLVTGAGGWIGFQLVHQNGRLLAHLEQLERRLSEALTAAPAGTAASAGAPSPAPAPAPLPAPAAPTGLPLGAPAPEFALPDRYGDRRALADFRGRKLLLIFFNPGCGFCTRMAPDLAALPIDGANGRPLPLVLTTGEAEENRKLFAEHDIHCPVLLQEGMEIASQYQCSGTPMGYLIDEQGRIASELAVGGPALLALAAENRLQRPDAGRSGGIHRDGQDRDSGTPGADRDRYPVPPGNPVHPVNAAPGPHAASGRLGGQREMSDSKLQRDGLPAGTPAPNFTLPLLHGGELSLSEYRGRKVLLVFSDPKCGPCDQLAPRLEQLARRTAGVQVLLVSKGELEANRAKAAQHGLTFPIVLQKQWEVSREYAKFATPIAYLIDAGGIIAREIAIGVEPILSLLAPPAVAPSNGNGKVARDGKEPAHRR